MASNFLKIYKGVSYAPQSSAPTSPDDGDIYYDSTLNKFRGYQNGSWQDLITDGADGINYILNPGAEADASGYITYADAASTSPVDGTGGSPSFVSFARTTTASEILRQDASFKYTKSSGNAQGEGVAYDFSIDPRDKNDKLQISFDYKNLDSNYVNGDIKMFVYDIDNSTLIGNVVNDDDGDVLIAPEDGGSFYGEFFATDSLNYRLIFHIAGTTSANWDLSLDRIKAGPVQAFVAGSAVNEIETKILPSSVTTNGTVSALSFTGLEIGTTYEVRGRVSLRTNSGGSANDNADIGFRHDGTVIDYALFDGSTSATDTDIVNLAISFSFTATATTLDAETFNVDSNSFVVGDGTRSNTYVQLEKRNDLKSNLVSNNKLNQTASAVVATHSGGVNFSNNATAILVYDIEERDTHNAYDSSTGIWTCPKTGWYEFHAQVGFSALTPGSGVAFVQFQDPTLTTFYGFTRTPIEDATQSFECKRDIFFKKGDQAVVSANQQNGAGRSTTVTNSFHQLSIKAVPDFTSYGVLNPNTEYVEAENTATVYTATADVEVDVGSMSIDLTPGTWDIGYDLAFIIQNQSGGSNTVAGRVQITDSSNAVLARTSSYNSVTSSGNAVEIFSVSRRTQVVVTSNTTYKIRITSSDTATSQGRVGVLSGNGTGAITGLDNTSLIWARRVK